ncbi:TetR/AcrR family transcriptional regulator [Amycolatopsis acidicola]|uniref:TetR/AcrR family transcriptional regulator n=1 Tax=Amycolatopsis acidicola TaxID=2596893 RepID=A0A5N0UWR2_9PSEU|nr:TetR/AcrR family transcriptional regulator [Amycolatopsis acidicola]KAA9156550.1 TetR/AcrR family transcriptional regulator [Amycolatopsis acidicola]
MRRPAWNGSPPLGGEEARARIIEAAMRCVDRYGPDKARLSDVAVELGVIRQTVYRYFPSTEELFAAVGDAARENYVNRLVAHVAGVTAPGEVLVEILAYTIERVPRDPYLGLFLTAGQSDAFSRRAMSAAAFESCQEVLARVDVDWGELGYEGRELTDLVEFLLRILLSFLDDPLPRRDGAGLRRFLRRWVLPAVVSTVDAGGYDR